MELVKHYQVIIGALYYIQHSLVFTLKTSKQLSGSIKVSHRQRTLLGCHTHTYATVHMYMIHYEVTLAANIKTKGKRKPSNFREAICTYTQC